MVVVFAKRLLFVVVKNIKLKLPGYPSSYKRLHRVSLESCSEQELLIFQLFTYAILHNIYSLLAFTDQVELLI